MIVQCIFCGEEGVGAEVFGGTLCCVDCAATFAEEQIRLDAQDQHDALCERCSEGWRCADFNRPVKDSELDVVRQTGKCPCHNE